MPLFLIQKSSGEIMAFMTSFMRHVLWRKFAINDEDETVY